MVFNISDQYVKPDSLVFQGKITYPDKQAIPFSILEGSGASRETQIEYTESGVHRVSVSAFGETINGREFRLVMPEFSFNVEHTDNVLLPDVEGIDQNSVAIAEEERRAQLIKEREEALARQIEEIKAEKKAKEQLQLIIIIAGNAIIVIGAIIGLMIYFRKKRQKSE